MIFQTIKYNNVIRTYQVLHDTKVLLENGWNSKQMITEGKTAIPLGTNLDAFHNQEKTKQRSTIVGFIVVPLLES